MKVPKAATLQFTLDNVVNLEVDAYLWLKHGFLCLFLYACDLHIQYVTDNVALRVNPFAPAPSCRIVISCCRPRKSCSSHKKAAN